MRNKYFFTTILLVIIGVNLCLFYSPTNSMVQSQDEAEDPINILLLMDDNWGSNCIGIIGKFESFGWNITFGSVKTSVLGCFLMDTISKPMDILISDIDNVTDYDCITIMPGSSYPNFYQNTQVNTLLQDAVGNETYVSSWCKAISIFADADIIDGKNVTGHIMHMGLAQTAGATFFIDSVPITDGYVITAVRSRFYQMEHCIAIAQAVGTYEADPPEIADIIFDRIGPDDYNISVIMTDATDTIRAKLTLNALTEVKINDVAIEKFIRTLVDDDGDNVYNYTYYDLPSGNYSADIETMDAFWNEILHEDVFFLDNTQNETVIPTNAVGFSRFALSLLFSGSFTLVVAVIIRKIRREK
ncbi:MAG: DJ-1/PfpI family protein [Candidatus Heimdallarchaeota archaeon]